MVISLRLNELFRINYDYITPKVEICFPLTEKDTYIVIFNKDQYGGKKMFETLVKTPGIKIIYQSPPAVNKVPHHGREPRNFVVIFEYDKPVQTMPEMQVAG